MQPAELKNTFRRNLRARRTELGLTQQTLANRVDVPHTYISDLERGRFSPSLATIATLAEALDTTPSVLLSGAVVAVT